MPSRLATVLVVEDEALIALDLKATLEEAGYNVLGPANSPAAAISLIDSSAPDVALLDVNLGRTDVFGVADRLTNGNTALIFLTGHTAQRLPPRHRHDPLISKPYLPNMVLDAVENALTGEPSAGNNAA
jgi:CheY-like chemotaxis protein